MGMEIPQGDINTNLITSTITSILTHTQHHNHEVVMAQVETQGKSSRRARGAAEEMTERMAGARVV